MNNDIIIKPTFDEAENFYDGIAKVVVDEIPQHIKKDGSIL